MQWWIIIATLKIVKANISVDNNQEAEPNLVELDSWINYG